MMATLQTPGKLPDMAGLEAVQQFSVLNQITLSSNTSDGDPYMGQNSPVNRLIARRHRLPLGVYTFTYCPTCQGLDYNDVGGDNEALISKIVQASSPGFYVFSAPWETTSAMLAKINTLEGFHLKLPSNYGGPNVVYVISITPSGTASLITYNSNVVPPTTYPVLVFFSLVSGVQQWSTLRRACR